MCNLCAKYHKPITVQYNIIDDGSWVLRLTYWTYEQIGLRNALLKQNSSICRGLIVPHVTFHNYLPPCLSLNFLKSVNPLTYPFSPAREPPRSTRIALFVPDRQTAQFNGTTLIYTLRKQWRTFKFSLTPVAVLEEAFKGRRVIRSPYLSWMCLETGSSACYCWLIYWCTEWLWGKKKYSHISRLEHRMLRLSGSDEIDFCWYRKRKGNPWLLNSLAVAVVINCLIFCGFKEDKCILLQFRSPQVPNQFPWA